MQHEKELGSGILERMYVRILDSCESKFAPYILGILSFTESCCFIIPPEVLLLPMSYANRRRAFHFAFITTITSVFGAVAGYLMGAFVWDVIQPFVFQYIPGFSKYFAVVLNYYQKDAIFWLFLAAFTPIPFKVYTVAAGVTTVAAGVNPIALWVLILTSLVGRGLRYGILSGIVYFFGERCRIIIERHFKTFTIAFMVIALVLLALIKLR